MLTANFSVSFELDGSNRHSLNCMLCHAVYCYIALIVLCLSVCQLALVCAEYDRKLPTPSAGANDICC